MYWKGSAQATRHETGLQVKLFVSHAPDKLEQEVNGWMKSNAVLSALP